MLDLSYFQNSGNVNTQTFTNAGSWVTWQKPRGAKLVNILCIGSGGGGGGANITGSTPRGGGSGGGAGGIVRAQFQASILPDILYAYTGIGGSGGLGAPNPTNTSGSVGEKSYVCIIPDTSSISNIVVTSGNVSARGGIVGGTGVTTTAAGETIATTANALFLNLGTFIAVAGTAGTAGGTTNVSSTTGVTPTQITSGGSGGGGNGAAGGGAPITAAGPLPGILGGAQGTGANNGGNGSNGIILYKPILGFLGGSGGGGVAVAGTGTVGGNGGNAAYGCGGGGGGAASTSGGNGGRGGDGIIIITTSF